MRLILLGPPGAGKGTQATWISARYHIPRITAGDMLRAAVAEKTSLGLEAQVALEKGQLVSDALIITLIRDRIQQADCQKGFVLDGFPRSLNQAEAFKKDHIPIDAVIELAVPDAVVIQRLSGRRIHPASGRIYHILYHPPKIPDQDDMTGENLIQREDDGESTIQKRLTVYHEQTRPLLAYYQESLNKRAADAPKLLLHIAGDQPPFSVKDQIFKQLDKIIL
jgi:adenylate kinase